MKRLRLFTAFAVFVLAIFACGTREDPSRIRVVLITLDTLRFDRFEPLAGATSAMPLTRAHAVRGLVLDRHYTVSPVTQPSHATLLTGRQPWDHGVTRNGVVLSSELPNIVDAFKKNGYETRAVVASFPLTRRFGFARGFDEFTQDFSHNLNRNKTLWEGHWKIESGEFSALGDSITDQALAALGRSTGKKQFFWFHYFDPHAPYGASSGAGAMRKKDIMKGLAGRDGDVQQLLEEAKRLYDKDVKYLDAALDRLLRKLSADEARFETHIIVVSDHGESLGEGGSVGHGARLHEAELRVPAFVISPRVVSGVRKEVSSTLDIAPTLLSLAGITMEGQPLPGHDLTTPAEANARAFAIRRTFREPGKTERRLDGRDYPLDGTLFCEIDSDGKIVRGNRGGLAQGEDITTTPGREQIIDRFRAFEAALERTSSAKPMNDEVRRGLEALGYIE
jgi:arylsulfatase A-like enzyme